MRENFSADPTVVFLTSVLDDIAHGRIRIPRFQRPLVWNWSQRKEFLESIFAGLPIGALMIWLTSNDQIGCYDSLGPHILPASGDNEGRYLMDGVQRISTLYGALRATRAWSDYDAESDKELRDFVVYADLDAEDDVDRFKRSIDIDQHSRQTDPTRYLPLSIILQSRELLRFQRELADGNEERLDRADEVASAFRQYKVPIITLKSASLEVVTKSFERINSRGADMSELHMLNALTYSPTFDLLKRDQELRREMLSAFGWQAVDSDIVLRCLKLNLGVDIYKTNPDEVSGRLRDDPDVLDRTFLGLRHTARFFKDCFSIGSPLLVPYRIQIVAIATLPWQEEGSHADSYGLLKDWVWLSTYTELFGGTGRQSEIAIGDLRNLALTGTFEWSLRERPAVRSLIDVKSDLRAARVKALMLAISSGQERSPQVDNSLLAEYGSDAFQFISLPKVDRGDQGARFLIRPSITSDFRQRLIDGAISEDEKRSHLISDEAFDLVDSTNMRRFTRMRAKDLFTYELREIVEPAVHRLGLGPITILAGKESEVERRDGDFGI